MINKTIYKEKLAEMCGIHTGDGYLRNDGKRIKISKGIVHPLIYYKGP